MARRKRWIQSAIKRPGQLHRDLGIPAGEKIPLDMLKRAAEIPGKVGERARLALRLRGFNPRRRAAKTAAPRAKLIPAKLKRMPNGRIKVLVSPGDFVKMRVNPRRRRRRR